MNDQDNRPTDYVAAGGREAREQAAHGGAGAARAPEQRETPLFPENDANDLRSRWETIQTSFVDDPRTAVKQADDLVAHATKRLAESFSNERQNLERQWDKGDNISTEDLRVALQRYRSFFSRLLSV